MHRSGTSMLARTLRELSVNMGRKRTRNEECRWTNKLNYWIFTQASATWERPEGADTLFAEPDLCNTISDYLQGVVSGPASIRYLGPWRWMRYRSLFKIAEPWGWKDPRNTFTLPIWLGLFPRARVIHIMRHGVDVAQSLRKRHKGAAQGAVRRYWSRRGLYVNNPLAPKRRGFAHAPRVANLEGGLALWELYTSRGCSQVRDLGNQALELRYEDLLQDPVYLLRRVTDFCGIEASKKVLQSQAERFDPNKAFAYSQSGVLSEFAAKNVHKLEKFGYEA